MCLQSHKIGCAGKTVFADSVTILNVYDSRFILTQMMAIAGP